MRAATVAPMTRSSAPPTNTRLEGIEALSFDLFDTLVDQDLSRLPVVEWEGKRIPGTAEDLCDRIAQEHPVDMGRLLAAMREVDAELGAPRYAEGRELPTLERFGEVLRRLGAGNSALASDLTEIHMSWIERCTDYRPHHGDVLKRLHAKRRIALCSNFSHSPTALRVMAQAGLLPHFDVLIVSDAVDSRKPFRPIFEAVLDGLGVAPERVLHVGDRLRADVSGPSELGMRTAWITRCVKDREAALDRHDGPAPDLEIEDLSELEALLD